MRKIGMEKEYFVKNLNGDFCLVPNNLPKDACGFLVEARIEPVSNSWLAAGALLAEEKRLQTRVRKEGVVLDLETNVTRLSPELRRQALNQNGKSPVSIERGNIYKLSYPAKDVFQRVGLHVHFSDTLEETISVRGKACKECGHAEEVQKIVRRSVFLDFPNLIQALDSSFKEEIKAAKRFPGFYELKSHGGFEYRSLPATIDLWKLAECLQILGW